MITSRCACPALQCHDSVNDIVNNVIILLLSLLPFCASRDAQSLEILQTLQKVPHPPTRVPRYRATRGHTAGSHLSGPASIVPATYHNNIIIIIMHPNTISYSISIPLALNC